MSAGALLAWVYLLLYPRCTVSVFDVGMAGGPGFVALDDQPRTWSTCGGSWPRVRKLYGRDLLVEVCDCPREGSP